MPGVKSLGRWPVIFADYQDAVSGKIKPISRELFLDYQNKDAYFYSPTGQYVSIVNLIREGVYKSWLPPCSSLTLIKLTYPDPGIGSCCAATDTKIIYEYIGDGNWIPVSSNSITFVSSTQDGILKAADYTKLLAAYNRTNIIFVDLNGEVPLPGKRAKNTIYEICKEVCVDPNEVIWDHLDLVESIESAIKDPWDWDQLFDVDLETDEIYEITDGLHKIVVSEMLIDPDLVIPEGYSYAHYLCPASEIIENIKDATFIENAYDDDWEFEKLYDFDEKGEVHVTTNVGFVVITSPDQLGSMNDRVGKNGIESVYYMCTKEVADQIVVDENNES